jgi:hypothetical protein
MIGGRHLYVMQMAVTGAVKIGRSSDVERRRSEIQTGCPYKVRTILVLENQGHRERALHKRLRPFRTRRYSGEWFSEESLPSLPDPIYELLDLETADWWRAAS